MMPVAILAGGLATRLRPKTEKIPKSLLTIAGKPFISWQLKDLAEKGIKHVVICAGHLGNQIENYVGTGSQWGLEVKYSHDGNKLLGTGGALKKAAPLLGDNFFVLYGDSYLPIQFDLVEMAFIRQEKPGMMVIYHNQNRLDRSNIHYERGDLIKYSKTEYSHKMEYIDYGLSVLSSGILERIKSGERYDLGDIFEQQVSQKNIAAFVVGERFYEIGSQAGLLDCEEFIMEKD